MADRATAPAVIAFDLDGTLVDTAPDLLDTLDVVLDEAGARPPGARGHPQDDRRRRRALVQRGSTPPASASTSRKPTSSMSASWSTTPPTSPTVPRPSPG